MKDVEYGKQVHREQKSHTAKGADKIEDCNDGFSFDGFCFLKIHFTSPSVDFHWEIEIWINAIHKSEC